MAYDGRPKSGTRSIPITTQSAPPIPPEHLRESYASNELATSTGLTTTRTYASDDSFLEISDSSPSAHSVGSKETTTTSDKKRNKLGYHRTAVACGHCRRRKIRCIPANDDESGRCQNCIRLKKECQFFPVDLPGQPCNKPSTPASKPETVESLSKTAASRSPGHFGAPSSLPGRENGEPILTGPLPLHDPFQGPWVGEVARVDQPVDFRIRQNMGYTQSSHHPRPANYTVPSNSFDSRLNPYITPPHQHQPGSPGSFSQSPFGVMVGSGSITTASEPGMFNFAQPGTGIDQTHWTPETATSRSVSVADTDEFRSPNSGYHHADPYISMNRRISEVTDAAELQHLSLAQHMKNQHIGVSASYSDPTILQHPLQHGMGWQMTMAPGVGHPAPVSEEVRNQAWYLAPGSCQATLQQGQHSRFYESHPTAPASQQFQPKPG